MLANLPSYPAQMLVNYCVKKTTKNAEFVPTMRLGFGVVIFPLSWLVFSLLAGLFAPLGSGWLTAGFVWLWGVAGSRFFAWSTTQEHDLRDASDGRSLWHDDSNGALRQAWTVYLESVNN